jgi:hypothetical protein
MIFPGILLFILSKVYLVNSIDAVFQFVHYPFPLWEMDLTQILVQEKWEQLQNSGDLNRHNYSTVNGFIGKPIDPISNAVVDQYNDKMILLEPFSKNLADFYNEHGLPVASVKELKKYYAFQKLVSALALFKNVDCCHSFIFEILRSIQILKQDDPEMDMSYSHPHIPFSIFVSICEDQSDISNLRVAESILHECMHLKLSLVENILPMVKTNTNNVFFSPWRDEKRPAQGILHGLFVFRAIINFYEQIEENYKDEDVVKFIRNRREQSTFEISQLGNFDQCIDLTPDGAILIKNLLP